MKKKINRSVFDIYAHEYDWLTNAAKREPNHQKEITALIERFHPTRILDAGCATGLTTMLFAKAGVPAVGLDQLNSMLRIARQKYSGSNLPLSFRLGSFEKIPQSLAEKFDLVVCLANSLSGVDSKTGLRQSLAGFKRALKPGGSLVLQLLNFESLKDGDLLPVRATEHDNIVYLRYLERARKRISLHVLRLDTAQSPPAFEPFKSEFDAFTRADIAAVLKSVGFGRISAFSDLFLSRRFSRASRDLVVTAVRM